MISAGRPVTRELSGPVARPLGGSDELFLGLRVLDLDGTLPAVPDSAANNDAFGKSSPRRSPVGYPQAIADGGYGGSYAFIARTAHGHGAVPGEQLRVG
ncbi:hypothetical protein KVH22_11515 [Streptomyces olivaceus]|uniref:hypothetical protein n=1 Tax=Streptomyces TaxID=1883 RepID=UPI001CC959C9|nr:MULTISPECIES: hypothetical protein [Streptomyces]MBZ6140605.1 hypothetical protein [Streptomyces olivaceus]MBZ6168367.1 hypothetical protein [Streptomyces olivaceus]MBZ6175151.1 hypothetical protein [Streptomyces olivaceus]MBZ6181593.1 hypothetical protein [Streptomyces olivaceus]MBZ6256182.1 hypothetical protein [Streptomyces olivaceus]